MDLNKLIVDTTTKMLAEPHFDLTMQLLGQFFNEVSGGFCFELTKSNPFLSILQPYTKPIPKVYSSISINNPVEQTILFNCYADDLPSQELNRIAPLLVNCFKSKISYWLDININHNYLSTPVVP